MENDQIHWETPVKMREGVLYWYLQYSLTLWAEPRVDSQVLFVVVFHVYFFRE